MSRVQTGALGIVVMIALLVMSTDSVAYDTYSTDGTTGNCASCHGEFKGDDYTSNVDGTAWNDHLMKGHENFINDSGNSKCDVCHSGSNRSPTYLSLSDLPAKPHGCVGCHGRTEDGPGQTGDGLRAHHMGADAYNNWPGGIPGFLTCDNCHSGDTATPVGEEILPFNYFLAGTVSDPCTSENWFGPTGLDNDGDGAVDAADADCAMTVPTPGDLNFDGMADILWRNASTGQNWVYLMDGAGIDQSRGINTVAGAAWEIVGNGDYDGDGDADILWRNSSTGQNWMYLIDSGTIDSSVGVNTVADAAWKVVGNGDYDGDGNDDVLWRHDTTHQVVIYFMTGASFVATTVDLWDDTRPDSTWDIVQSGDYNGDGMSDILWHSNVTGQVVMYLMNGAAIDSKPVVITVSNTDWQIVGSGDYNGDGFADILWRNYVTGQNWMYLMSGASIDSTLGVNTVSNTFWEILGSGDYNGDGNADILWCNSDTGQNWVYLMTGATIGSSVGVNTVSDTAWQVVNTR